MNKKYLAIIPARIGSKRLKEKNILDLAGRPLVQYTIDAAKKSNYIDKVVLSSDAKKVLDIASESNVEILLRPKKLAEDTTSTISVIEHVLETYSGYEYVILLQPTSPLRNEFHIDEAIELLEMKKASGVISVCRSEHSPLWSNTLDTSCSMKGFLNSEILNKRAQDLSEYYRLNGAIYICNIEKLLKEKTFFLKDNIYAYKMKREDSVDIDEAIELKLANLLLSERE